MTELHAYAAEDEVPAVSEEGAAEPVPSPPQEGLDSDFALALAMQEAEQRELERITQYVRSHQHQKGRLPMPVYQRSTRGHACIAGGLRAWGARLTTIVCEWLLMVATWQCN